jgi:hypothetical protein
MSFFGTPSTQGIAGALGASQQAREVRREPPKAKRPEREADEVITGAERVEKTDRARALAGNDQEDAREDRQENGAYGRDGAVQARRKGNLDVNG